MDGLVEELMSTRTLLRAALLAATALAGSGLIRPAAAQSDTQIQTIESQIKALQAELAHMKADSAARDRALKAAQDQAQAAQAQAAAAAAQQQALQAKLAELPVAAPVPAGPKLPLGTFRVGGVTVTLGGFTAGEGIFRSRNEAAGIDTNFNGNIPFRNSPNYYIPEYRFTGQQSRFALLAQGNVDNSQSLTSYMETDFLSAGSSSNNNQSNSYTLRVRQFYGEYDNSAWGFHAVAGQAWSLATPYRVGLIPRQENVPLTIDAQYVVGFQWERQAELRLVEDFADRRLWAGISFEEPATIFSGSAGPNCLTGASTLTANKLGTLEYAQCGGPNVNSVTAYSDSIAPDIIAKIAADPGFGHYELYSMLRFLTGRVSETGSGHEYTTTGQGVGGSLIVPVVPRMVDFQLQGLVGQGVGRYGSAQLPDATFDASGKIKALPNYQIMGGFVAHPEPSVDIYAYGGTEQTMRKSYGDGAGYGNPTTGLVGCYSELGSCSANTSGVIEGTVGAWWRFLKGNYGTAQMGAQWEYIVRDAFSGAGATKGSGLTPTTNENAFLISFRYLPFQ